MNVKQQCSACSTTLSPNASLNQILCTLSSHFLFHSLCFLCLDYDSGSTNSCQKKKRNRLYSHVTRKIRKKAVFDTETNLVTNRTSFASFHPFKNACQMKIVATFSEQSRVLCFIFYKKNKQKSNEEGRHLTKCM